MARVAVPVTTLGFVKAAYTTALTGAQNDLVYTARDGGPGGNNITIAYIVAGASTPLAVVVNGNAIVVNVATDGGSAATSTAYEVKTAVAANGDAARLVTVALAASNDGTGVVTALSAAPLTGGTLGVLRPSQTASDATNKHYFTGNDGTITLEVENVNAASKTVTFELAQKLAPGMSLSSATQTETIANGTVRVLGPFNPTRFNQNDAGDVYFTPELSTDLKFRALKTVKA